MSNLTRKVSQISIEINDKLHLSQNWEGRVTQFEIVDAVKM